MTEVNFEDALKKLETIVEELEDGDISLDESMKKYEEGVKLSHVCSKKLEGAQKKVEMLVKTDSGNLEARSFDKEDALKEQTHAVKNVQARKPKKSQRKTSGSEGLLF